LVFYYGQNNQKMKSSAQDSAGFLKHLAGALGALAVSFLPLCVPAAGLPGSLQTSNLENVIYGDDFFKPVAAVKIGRIFTDHRRLGFFHIQLLPVLVAEGVHLEFAQASPQTNWLEGFRFDPAPSVGRSAVEWRDFSVSLAQEKLPRLQAERVHPTVNASSVVCQLEGVTVQAGPERLKVPKAELRAEGQSGQVVWTCFHQTIQWDLFTGQCKTNSIERGLQNENP
jgi:hypothetical protein